jgi:hypothetical protein
MIFVFLKLFSTKYILFTTIKMRFRMVTGCDHNLLCAKDEFLKITFLQGCQSSFYVPFWMYVQKMHKIKRKQWHLQWFSLCSKILELEIRRAQEIINTVLHYILSEYLLIHSFIGSAKPGIVWGAKFTSGK